tara:strand:- start:751 stop:2445 length:1695 start_codon:yes stop_codon:yes gene_type:complete
MSDYLKDSRFGQVATSLLGQGRKAKRRDFVYSLLGGFLKGQQRRLKQGLTDSYNNLQMEYDSIFKNNKAKYELSKDDRADYQSYLKDPEEFKRLKGIELFNKDPSILASDKNYSQISELDPESKKYALELYNKYKDEAEKNIQRLGKAPEVSMATYEMYNKAAIDSYKAKYAALSNDPAKQNLLNAAFAKIFPNMFAAERGQYEIAVENAEANKKSQDRMSLNYVKPLEQQEQEDNQASVDNINKAAQEVEMPMLYTSAERLKLDKNSFLNKVNQSGYKLTLEDLDRAAVLGVEIPGLPGFNDLIADDRPILQSAFVKAQKIKSEGQNPLDVLMGRERDVYAIALGTTAMDYDKRNMDFEYSQLRLESMKQPDPTKAQRTTSQYEAEVRNADTRVAVRNTILDVVAQQPELPESFADFEDLLSSDLKTSAGKPAEASFVTQVIRTAQQLQEDYQQFQTREGLGRSYREAVKIQLAGIQQTKTSGIFGGREFTYEPVDSRWMALLDKDSLNQKDAEYFIYGLNNYGYTRNIDPSLNNQPGNQLIQGPYRFYVRNDGFWDYEIIED